MKQYIKKYNEDTLNTIENNKVTKDTLEDYLCHIKFFQHERFIHLVVTALFAVLTILSAGIAYLKLDIATALLALIFLMMTIAYIMHYYFLENSVQSMYHTYDRMKKILDNKDKEGQN